jgi:hypothetical protein
MIKKKPRTPAQKASWGRYLAHLARMLTIGHERALRAASWPRDEKKPTK